MTPHPARSRSTDSPPSPPLLGAVIDIGATSVRMQIAEIHRLGGVRKLESFSQAVSVGNDSFMKGSISKQTIKECVRVLQIYRKKLDEYRIVDRERIRVIATSGVREASNRLAFVDRIFVATGFEIEPFEEAELHRVTYLGILPFLHSEPDYFRGATLVMEVGGGTSEVLLLHQADVEFSRTYRLGALRLRKLMDRYDAPVAKSRALIEAHVLQTIKQLKDSCPITSPPDSFVTMGGEVRFAANEINQQPVGEELVKLSLKDFRRFTENILEKSPDRLATKYHMSLTDAQTLGPALLTQLIFAQELGVKQLLVANVSLRDGLLKEMAEGSGWADSIQQQIVRSAIQTGKKYKFDQAHAVHVAQLACSLFDQLESLHKLPERFRRILQLAALLHDIGYFINSKSRHKHSMYLIRNSEFFGIGSSDLELIALVSRYHRRANPQPNHDGYARLDRVQRVTVSKLAAILRVAKALDASLTQRVRLIRCHVTESQVVIESSDAADLSLEQMELSQASGLFDIIFGRDVVLRLVEKKE